MPKKGDKVKMKIPRRTRRFIYNDDIGTVCRIEADSETPYLVELSGNLLVFFPESELVVLD